jgi:hypothetical protein
LKADSFFPKDVILVLDQEAVGVDDDLMLFEVSLIFVVEETIRFFLPGSDFDGDFIDEETAV